jgi:putative acyl-CoA dehydrogenase
MIATAVEAALLVRHSTNAVADAFVTSRLERMPNRAFGSLPRGTKTAAIIARSLLS